jgi:IPTL-CTERM motif
VRRFLPVLLLMGGLVAAGGANAISVKWTIPPTALTATGSSSPYSSVSGTFDWDAVNQVVSNVNLSLVVNGMPTPINSSSVSIAPYLIMNNTGPSLGSPVVFLDSATLTNNATPAMVSFVAGGECLEVNGADCVRFGGPNVSIASNVTLTPASPPPPAQPIPTLSEWAQIMMMLMMIATAGFYGWRMKQR